ncbi:MAG TPA: flagellar assembly peptidoglycan hydrolase FlgJ [Azoarcus taiwanensis]|nr:flagellar assembly peptidoglycan hydrolase FlgJ [Azoarcus taiwanensis]
MSVELNQLNVLDPNSFGDLKRLAREGNSPDALRAAAKQFEGLFMQMMLKAMRDATPANGLFDNDQTRMLQSFQDQQMAMQMAQGSGIGLADVIFRQMGGEHLGVTREPTIGQDGKPVFDLASVPRRAAISALRGSREASAAGNAAGENSPASGSAATASGVPSPASSVSERVGSFVGRVWSHAIEAARSIGVPPQFMVAQAALETGWGRAELRTRDGQPSHNVFNIKAGRNWKGPVVELPVTEYADGRPYTEKARFRVYGSYAEAFQDFANLMRNNPRYANVLGQSDPVGFARSLQTAGYATDPLYADKLASIITGPTLRAALGG